MNKSQMITLYDQDQRIDVEFPAMRREVGPNVVRHIDTSDFGKGLISYSQLDEANADNAIREQVSYFEGIGQDFKWKLFNRLLLTSYPYIYPQKSETYPQDV